MMGKILKLISGWLMVVLGSLHTIGSVMFLFDSEKPPIVTSMEAFKIEMFGIYSLMQFYQGFSWLTGAFSISAGVFVLLITKRIEDKVLDFALLFNIGVIFLVAIIFFHPLAYGMSGLAFVFFTIGLLKK